MIIKRYEFKYILPTKLIDILLPTVYKYLSLDPNAENDGFYSVNSMYFDSPNFDCYYEKIEGLYSRKKYRLRFYESPINSFFEIKRKYGDIVIKNRALLSFTRRSNFSFKNDIIEKIKDSSFQSELMAHYSGLKLTPTVLVIFKRKPFVSIDNNFRITIDYDIKATDITNNKQGLVLEYLNSKLSILEIKFHNSVPHWVINMINNHSLVRTIFSKYGNSVEKFINLGNVIKNYNLDRINLSGGLT